MEVIIDLSLDIRCHEQQPLSQIRPMDSQPGDYSTPLQITPDFQGLVWVHMENMHIIGGQVTGP